MGEKKKSGQKFFSKAHVHLQPRVPSPCNPRAALPAAGENQNSPPRMGSDARARLREGSPGSWLHPHLLRASFTLSLFTHNPKEQPVTLHRNQCRTGTEICTYIYMYFFKGSRIPASRKEACFIPLANLSMNPASPGRDLCAPALWHLKQAPLVLLSSLFLSQPQGFDELIT